MASTALPPAPPPPTPPHFTAMISPRQLVQTTLLLLLPSLAARAGVLHWDSDGTFPAPEGDPNFGRIVDGGGTWQADPANLNWSADGGATNIDWTNPVLPADPHDAVFGNGGDSSATVSITGVIRAGNITFQPLMFPDVAYTISGAIELRKSLPLSELTLNHDAIMASSSFTGIGYVKKGPGRLQLSSNVNAGFSYTSSVDISYDISEGTVELGPPNTTNSRSFFREGVIRIAAGAKVKLLSPQRIQDDRTIIRIDDGGTFDLNGQTTTGALSTVTGVALTGAEKFGYLEGTGTFRTGAENFVLHYGGGAEMHTFNGGIGGTGHVWVDAANIKSYSVQELAGVNTFTGSLGVYTGTLAFQGVEALGFSTDPVIHLGTAIPGDNPVHGILRYTGGGPVDFSRPLHLYSAGTAGTLLGGGGFESSGGPGAAVSLSSTITSANGEKPFILGGTNTDANLLNTVLSDVIVDDGINPPARFAVSLQKHGPGTWHLPHPGAFSGGVEMNDGTLHLDHPQALNGEPGRENSLLLHGGTLMLNGNSLVLGNGSSGPGLAGAGGTIRNDQPAPVTLTVRNHAAQTQVFRGSVSDAGGGAISLIKQGPGSLTLAARAHSYSGSTAIEAGTLRVEATAAALPVSGAQWHLDASDAATITESGGVVTAWNDKSVFRRHATLPLPVAAVAVTRPAYIPAAQNGLAAVRFNGVSDVLSSATGAAAGTVFIVCSNAANGDGSFKGGGVIGGNGLGGVAAQNGIRGPRGGIWYGSGENIDIARPSGSEFRVNGAQTTRVTPAGDNYWHTVTAVRSGSTVNYNSIGGFPSLQAPGDNYWFRGDIGEVIVYNRVLTAEERSRVEAYLQQKWFGGTVSSNLLPVTTTVSVSAGAVFDSAAPQTIAGLNLQGALKIGAPAGELVVTGAATVNSGAVLHWDVADWNGNAGSGYDVLTSGPLTFSTVPETPVTVKIGQPPVVAGAARTARDFTIMRSTGTVTGFDASHFTLDAAAFTAVPGAWSLVKSGSSIVLHFEPEAAGPYDLWIQSFGLSGAAAGPAADPDGDGWANILEFGVNGNPASRSLTAAVAGRIATLGGEPAFTITVPVRSGAVFSGAAALAATADGVTFVIEGSDAADAWTLDVDEVTPALSAGLPSLPDGWEYRTFRTPGSVNTDAADFMRVKVQAAP